MTPWTELDWTITAFYSSSGGREHSFHVVKNLFYRRKTHYCGLAKSAAKLSALFGFANLVLAYRWLLDSNI